MFISIVLFKCTPGGKFFPYPRQELMQFHDFPSIIESPAVMLSHWTVSQPRN